jgi:hemerythrin-like domain-containing protein
MPIGPLMVEHRLIEQMVGVMEKEVSRIRQTKSVDPEFIDSAVDFIRTYADRCHHGKEEDILFRDMAKKKLSKEHRGIMCQLIEEHVWGRKITGELAEANESYLKMGAEVIPKIIDSMEQLARFYPPHIEKEDKHFFIPVMEYFTRKEQDKMLAEMAEFDKRLIHDKYRKVVEDMKSRIK